MPECIKSIREVDAGKSNVAMLEVAVRVHDGEVETTDKVRRKLRNRLFLDANMGGDEMDRVD